VENRLELKGEPVAENLDAWVSKKVKTSLLFHRNQSTSKTDVQVQDVEGLKGIQNEMTVSQTPGNPDEKTLLEKMGAVGESSDDASITALAKMTYSIIALPAHSTPMSKQTKAW